MLRFDKVIARAYVLLRCVFLARERGRLWSNWYAFFILTPEERSEPREVSLRQHHVLRSYPAMGSNGDTLPMKSLSYQVPVCEPWLSYIIASSRLKILVYLVFLLHILYRNFASCKRSGLPSMCFSTGIRNTTAESTGPCLVVSSTLIPNINLESNCLCAVAGSLALFLPSKIIPVPSPIRALMIPERYTCLRVSS